MPKLVPLDAPASTAVRDLRDNKKLLAQQVGFLDAKLTDLQGMLERKKARLGAARGAGRRPAASRSAVRAERPPRRTARTPPASSRGSHVALRADTRLILDPANIPCANT